MTWRAIRYLPKGASQILTLQSFNPALRDLLVRILFVEVY